jgi:hypothetical protein
LEDLLPPDVLQPSIQVLHPCGDIFNLALVRALDLVGLAYHQVEHQLDTAVRFRDACPSAAAGRRAGCEADLVVSGLGGGEVELSGRSSLL